MSKYSGVVGRVIPKEWPGQPPSYTITLDGQEGWFRLGKKRYAGIAEPGQKVDLEATANPDGISFKVSSVIPAAGSVAVVAGTALATLTGGGREDAIHYQSARKDAIEFLKLSVQAGSLKLPAAQAAKHGHLEALLDKYTAIFYDDISTKGGVTRFAEFGEMATEPEETRKELITKASVAKIAREAVLGTPVADEEE
jgi:hypothetical protein